jgi:uncharacterized protein (UPF0216 family)
MRIGIAATFLIMSALMIGSAFMEGGVTKVDFLLNLGTEIFGIVITVAIVDYLLELRKLQDEARRIAWEVLHSIDHAVWVWQGGARQFDIDELEALLDLATESDPVPRFTQNLLLQVGSKSENTLRSKQEVVGINNNLKFALETLRRLSRMRDYENLLPTIEIVQSLQQSIRALIKVVNIQSTVIDADGVKPFRSTSIENHEWRHFGRDQML